MNEGLGIAALFTGVTWLIHTFIGGPAIAGPLLASSLEPVPKLTNYYCWHLVTLTLAAMAIAYGYAAFQPLARDLAVFVTLLALSFMIFGMVLTLWKRRRILELPQWMLFALIVGAATAGLL